MLRYAEPLEHVIQELERLPGVGPKSAQRLALHLMRMDARDSARLMVNYAPYLYRHGAVIMTLKLPERSTPVQQRKTVEDALAILRQKYRIVGARQLFHNRSEVTVALRPLAA